MRKLNSKKKPKTNSREISELSDHSYSCDQAAELDDAGTNLEDDSTLSARPEVYICIFMVHILIMQKYTLTVGMLIFFRQKKKKLISTAILFFALLI